MEIVRQKNQDTYIVFPIIDNDGDAVSSAAGLDSEIDEWNDGGAPDGFVDCTNEATEIGSTGIYYLLLTAAEMNYDYIYIQTKTTTTDAKTQHLLIRTMTGDPLLLTTETNATTNKNSIITEIDANETKIDSIITSISAITTNMQKLLSLNRENAIIVSTFDAQNKHTGFIQYAYDSAANKANYPSVVGLLYKWQLTVTYDLNNDPATIDLELLP